MLNEVKLIENILPPKVNLDIIKYLANDCSWKIGCENGYSRIEMLTQKRVYAGLSFDSTFMKEHDWLNTCAYLISENVKNRLNINLNVSRFFWNMYYPGHKTLSHIDDQSDQAISFIYNLSTTDGGTIINNKFYADVAGQAKVFKSNIYHSGVGPKQDSCRFNLNVVFK